MIFAFSGISTLFVFLISSLYFKQVRTHRGMMLWWIYFALASLTEIILHIFSYNNQQSAQVFHIYTLVEYFMLTMILATWQDAKIAAKRMRLSIPIYIVVYALIKFVGLEDFSAATINVVTRPVALLMINVFSCYTLFSLWSNPPEKIFRDHKFWMLIALILYYNISLILSAFMFMKNVAVIVALFEIHAVVNIIHNILFAIGVFLCAQCDQDAGRDAQEATA